MKGPKYAKRIKVVRLYEFGFELSVVAFVLSDFLFLSLFFLLFFFFFQPHYLIKSTVNSIFMHCLQTHKFYFLTIFSLKMGPTALFTHLKIILLQCFQFQFSVSIKISSIQTDDFIPQLTWINCDLNITQK